ncbi:MAG: hydroxysqualene dehydroxylase HpnE [Gammaproteobacteria bacterium]
MCNPPDSHHTIVVGGGWSGIAAAVELSRQNIPVTLIECSKQLGGRARSVNMHGYTLDNGQHLMIGAYRNVLQLIKLLHTTENSVFRRTRLDLQIQSFGEKSKFCLKLPSFPAFGLLGCSLSLRDKYYALAMCFKVLNGNLDGDQPLKQYLINNRQSGSAIRSLWEPLCLATMNTPLHLASTKVFIQVLKDAFTIKREHSDLLYFCTDMSAAIAHPAASYINGKGNQIIYNQRVTGISTDNNQINGVIVADGQLIKAKNVILAIPPAACRKITAQVYSLNRINRMLIQLEHAPICTIYIQYPPGTRLSKPMVGIINSTSQWIFDRSIYGQDGLMSVVISSLGPHMQLSNDLLCKQVEEELACLFPEWPEPVQSMIIKEKRATFLCKPDIDRMRPDLKTEIDGLYLAGDYIHNNHPATLEGAVQSGFGCANEIINPINNPS